MENNLNLHFQSATNLVAALANKEISSEELVETTISRIEDLDKEINSVVVRDFERARASAKIADKAIAQHKRLPLLGLPITVKESFNISGLSTTWGNPQYKDWHPNDDALITARLKKAGAIIIGKTNVPFMLRDWQSYNELYGTTNNPWDLSRTPGGSSGGGAAALAAGFTSLELGSDFGGSIRVPANYCGVYGHKPSIDLVALRGSGPPTSPASPNPLSDLIVAGPMARTATDLTLALNVLAGPDKLWDGQGYQLALPPSRHKDLSHFRVLILDSHPLCPTATIVSKTIDDLIKRLTKSGVTISQDAGCIPDLAEITQTYMQLFAAYSAGNIPIEKYNKLAAITKKLDPHDMGIEACIMRGFSLTHRDWLTVMRTRNELRQQFRNIFKDFDLVLCPVMPTPAFPHNHSKHEKRQIEIDGSLFPFSNQFAWASIATVFGLPATVAPIGFSNNGLPIGIQIIGDYLEDYTTIGFADLLEREFGGFSVPPLLEPK